MKVSRFRFKGNRHLCYGGNETKFYCIKFAAFSDSHLGGRFNGAYEQTQTFASHLASISLTAIRYLLLLYAALEQDRKPGEVRADLSTGLMGLSFGQQLWGLFRCLINHTMESFRAELGAVADQFIAALDEHIHTFFRQALQLDSFTLELEARPEAVLSG